MNFEQAKEVFKEVNGSTFVGLDTETVVKLTGGKKNPHQGRVTKKTIGANVIVFANTDQNGYKNMVQRRMMQEGKDPSEFELKPRAWGVHISRTPFIEHNGKHYLECIFRSAGTSTYYLDGVEINKSDIEGLPEQKEPNEQSQGGIDNQIVLRTFALESIQEMRVKGETLTS